MKQYQVTARSPSLAQRQLDIGEVYLDEKLASQRAAELARGYNEINHQGTDDWEAWVLIQRHNPL